MTEEEHKAEAKTAARSNIFKWLGVGLGVYFTLFYLSVEMLGKRALLSSLLRPLVSFALIALVVVFIVSFIGSFRHKGRARTNYLVALAGCTVGVLLLIVPFAFM